MMEASLNSNSSPRRRRRYARQEPARPLVLTPILFRLLRYIAELKIVSLPQLARLAGPSHKTTRRHLRTLFDAGLVNVVAVPRAALAAPSSGNDASLLFGSAPNIYTITLKGSRLLLESGLTDEVRPIPAYGPRNSLFLAHELAVRDVRVWLELCARNSNGHQVLRWKDGPDAMIDLKRLQPPKVVCPDAWFVYRLGQPVLVGLVEVDRSTERGGMRWKQKIAAYEALFRGGRLPEVTGYQNARVLVIAPDARRRDALAELIATNATSELQQRFWLSDCPVLLQLDLASPVWRQPESTVLKALAPPAAPTDCGATVS